MRTGWKTITLGDACQIKPPKKEAKEKLAGTDLVSFVPMNNLGICAKRFELNGDKKLSEVAGSYTYFSDNDVLLAKITPYFENGKLGIANGLTNGIGFGSSEYIVFRSSGVLVPEYLFYFLLQDSFRKAGAKVMTGAVGHKRVPKELVENQEIPFPPLSKQKRIVAILDEAFAGISQAVANAEKNLANACELFESYLNNVFTQKGEGWVDISVKEISSVINGHSFKSGDFSENNSAKSIKITNVGVQEFIAERENMLPYEFIESYKKVSVSEGNIVIELTQSIISKGLKVAVVPPEYDGALLNQRVAGLIADTKIILSQYLFFYLCLSGVFEYVKNNVTMLMQPNLLINDLKKTYCSRSIIENTARNSRSIRGFKV